MNSITKYLLGSLVAVLLCAGQAALVAADTSATQPRQHSLDRPAFSAYHQQLLGFAPQGVSTVARR
jgi:hypothetical protein